ncbi:uncharacterized protein ACA1_144460 [Acanthamoeba castellanii str. Neff]|uniref:Uncharacterized protein n=1 Tax=Acanthamoeba castellanii (strain ATCC 30010 / Neff) TaxID=1257118 RepID=L8HEW6_ACACF|nr:uncharacterized protein ACA1_144460 [Acanthamoeba castellanii str. Neff]ELR24054.1 hypothetical protein ACA1_144460 [Acanthamoeba castellanii str. Neff]
MSAREKAALLCLPLKIGLLSSVIVLLPACNHANKPHSMKAAVRSIADLWRPVNTVIGPSCRFVGSLWLQLALLSCGEAVTLRVDAATAGGGDALQAPSLPTPTLPSRPSLPRRPPSPLPCSPARPGHLPRCSGSSSSTQMPLEIASSSLRQSSSTPS